ncbi:LapA family protein [Nocardia miyunensis]|uniref:LapA family protein n=1 Tax=Nocardia miyunensis TaxID=282684 RepID=UPI0012F4E63C|nr:lipopolysaccharide assembly protein LapA domain-containing protein [Nocardia miyunensis]
MTSDAASSSGPDTPSRTSATPESLDASGSPERPDSPTAPEPATTAGPAADSSPRTAPDSTARRAPANRSLRTRAGSAWVALVAAAIIGIILMIFILQNLNRVEVTLFFWSFSLPLGVTILLSLIAGTLVMALAGGWRIIQLRRAAKRA